MKMYLMSVAVAAVMMTVPFAVAMAEDMTYEDTAMEAMTSMCVDINDAGEEVQVECPADAEADADAVMEEHPAHEMLSETSAQ